MSGRGKQASWGNFYIKLDAGQMLKKSRTNNNEAAVRNTEKAIKNEIQQYNNKVAMWNQIELRHQNFMLQ